jgi:hypothetical protein
MKIVRIGSAQDASQAQHDAIPGMGHPKGTQD